MSAGLDSIFRPKSIAVIGASNKEGSIGYVIFNNILRYGYKGKLYPVNPNSDYVGDLKSYPSISSIDENIDMAVIVVPRDLVKQALLECSRKKVSGVVVITSGFKEIGGTGIAMEQELIDIVKNDNMRMIGPNCYGVVNTSEEFSLNATFSKLNPLRGKVAFMSQSGALGEVIIDYTNRLNLGFSVFASVGNKADVSDIDLLRYLKDDNKTEVILLYLENIDSPREFTQISSEISPYKPILAVKAGKTESGAKAVSSHTGVLAGGDVSTSAIFEKCGIIRIDTLDELFDVAMAFSNQPIIRGNRVAVITNAGGPGILATDAIESYGLKMARFEPETIEYLRANLSPMAAINNPIDVIASGGPDSYGAAIEAVLKDPNVDGLIVIFVPPILVDHQAVINKIIEKTNKFQNGKTVLCCLTGSPSGIHGYDNLVKNNLPVYIFPESAAKAMSDMWRYYRWKTRPAGRLIEFPVNRKLAQKIVNEAISAGKKAILGSEALEILNCYEVNIVKSQRIKTAEDYWELSDKFKLPLVMKIDDPRVIHKTDSGGVLLDLQTEGEVLEGLRQMRSKFGNGGSNFYGVLIQEMLKGGIETIIGMNNDPSCGPLMMFGLGGIEVEVMKDVAFRMCPVYDTDADEMIRSIKSFPLLNGFRGAPPADLVGLAQTIMRLSQLAIDFPIFESFDVNPFIITPNIQTSQAVDARFILKT